MFSPTVVENTSMLVVVGPTVGGHCVVVVKVVLVMTVRVMLRQTINSCSIDIRTCHVHRIPNHTRSEVVFAILPSPNDTSKTAITPNRAIAVVLRALLPDVENSRCDHGKVEEVSKGSELHLWLMNESWPS